MRRRLSAKSKELSVLKKARAQILLACLALLGAAAAAEAMTPRTLMARSQGSFDLETLIPKRFGDWSPVPEIRILEPPGSDTLSHEIYNQEIARGYVDKDGNMIMLLVAYGVSQSDRLQLHRPEICYAAQGFKVSRPAGAIVHYREDRPPLNVTRLIAQREGRFEPITYWMRIGNDVATDVLARQYLTVSYGLHGLVPDGALIRLSTIGAPAGVAFELQSRFIGDLISSLGDDGRKFLLGDPAKSLAILR